MRFIPIIDDTIGLRGTIALHAPALGPAFGGIRIAEYIDDAECGRDAARLATAMSYKCIFHEIPGGGGKTAVRAGLLRDREKALLRIAGEINALAGQYFSGPDTGFTADDTKVVAAVTKYVSLEDVTTATSRGVLAAITSAARHRGIDTHHLRVVVQGLGAVGLRVADALIRMGAFVSGFDVNEDARRRARAVGVQLVAGGDLLATETDVFCPCALGDVINTQSAASIPCLIIAGSANNPLTGPDAARILHDRGVTYVPDFAASGGGLIRGAWAHLRGTPGSNEEVDAIGARVTELLEASRLAGVSPLAQANRRIEGHLQKHNVPPGVDQNSANGV